MSKVEAQFNNRQFDNLYFPVMKHDKEADPITIFPELLSIPTYMLNQVTEHTNEPLHPFGFGPGLDKRMVFDYVNFCYDPASPILKKFMLDEKPRKTAAADYAGWVHDPATGFYPEAVDDLMHGKNERVNRYIIDFLRLFGDANYALLVVAIDSYFSSLAIIASKTESITNDSKSKNILDLENNKLKLITGTIEQKKVITGMMEEYLRDNNFNLRKTLFNVINLEIKNKLSMSPERRAGVVNA